MTSAIFVTFLTELAKIPNDEEQCRASMEAYDGYFLDVSREDDGYLVSHFYSRDEDPYSQYIADSSAFRQLLSEIPKNTRIKEATLYKNGTCIRRETY